MRILNTLLILSCTAALPCLAAIEPKGGTWKTFLTPVAQYRLPAPPNAAATQQELATLRIWQRDLNDTSRAQIKYWSAGAPSYRWVKYLTQRIANDGINTPNNTRAMALLNVAIYDATIAAWDSKYAHNRPGPSKLDPAFQPVILPQDLPSYPDEHAVAGGAAAAVLSYLFPNDAAIFREQALEQARARNFGGAAFPSDTAAGLELGERVAQLAIDRARNDGSQAVFNGTIPTGPEYWRGTNPVCPLCGTWKPYVLAAGNQFRPGPPPAYNSATKAAELAFLKSQPRTFADQAAAMYWQTQAGMTAGWFEMAHTFLFEDGTTANALRSARAYALLAVAGYDSMIAVWEAKYAYWAPRPFMLDSTLTTLFATPNHPSYPAAHSTNSTTRGEILVYLFPERAREIRLLSEQSGWSRMVAGIHYPSDHESGKELGRNVSGAVIDWANKDGSH